MTDVKRQIKEWVEIVRFQRLQGKTITQSYSLHSVLVGNPGTGKTTIARILAKTFKALGVLERGHLIETDRQGLVAGFVGQTAIKTSEKIDEANGGVLFIDEAYALNNFNGLQGDFGNEAIQTLLKRMEDDRGKFFLFVAGYPDNMEQFLKANPGLSSRFDKKIIFQDYNQDELFAIAEQMCKDLGYHLEAKAKIAMTDVIHTMILEKDKYFGNARAMRLLVQDIITQQNLRIASSVTADVTNRKLHAISQFDIEQYARFKSSEVVPKRQIGF